MAEIFLSDRALKRLKDSVENKKNNEFLKILHVLCGRKRFKIALALNYQKKEGLTVGELAKILNSSLSATSHQLRILRRHKLVVAKRINREVSYMLANHRIRNFFPF